MTPSSEVFARRRRALMDRIGPRAAAVFPAAPMSTRSNDVEYRYRQDSDLLYLTGFEEPEAVCLLLPGHPKDEFVLFVQPRDPEREVWTGRRAGVEGAIERFGAQMAYNIDQLEQKIGEYVGEREQLYYGFGRDAAFNERVVRWMQRWHALRPRSGTGPVTLIDPREIVHDMRLFKDADELACMRKAIAISSEAHRAAMRSARPGAREHEIEALLDYTFRREGGSGPAYPSIVASGGNATVLHYTSNNCELRGEDLLLIDAGAEYGGYCADITRTFPLGRQFTPPQRAVYELVLEAQLAAIEAIRPGARYEDPHRRAVEVLVDGLLRLKLLSGDREEIIAKEQYRPFYMHRTSHWLGLDVHDVGKYKVEGASRLLAPGMVLTVEPGIYIGPDRTDVDPRYCGIGVRIEDDVLVTPDGHEVLSAAAPKSVAEIETLRREAF